MSLVLGLAQLMLHKLIQQAGPRIHSVVVGQVRGDCLRKHKEQVPRVASDATRAALLQKGQPTLEVYRLATLVGED